MNFVNVIRRVVTKNDVRAAVLGSAGGAEVRGGGLLVGGGGLEVGTGGLVVGRGRRRRFLNM